MEHSTIIEASPQEVFRWHSRPGAIRRLLPPWLPLKVAQESRSLRDGTAVLKLPFGIPWSARHIPSEFVDDRRFVDRLSTPVLSTLLRWTHTHEFEPLGDSSTRVTDRVESTIPDRFIRQNLGYRARQLTGDLAMAKTLAQFQPGRLTVAVTGSTGLIGSALCAALTTGGHRVIRLVRSSPSGADERLWEPDHPAADLLDGVNAVIHLAGAPIAGRFTDSHCRSIRNSRVRPTEELAHLVADRPFIVASAIGFYGPDRKDELLVESSARGTGFIAEVVADWEAAADPALASGSRVVHVRTGIVQSPSGGALSVQRRLFLMGAGGRLGDGRQWVSWIGIDDIVDVYLRCLVDDRLSGAVNAVAPNPVRNSEFTRTLASVLRRPAILPVPSLGPRLIFGARGAQEFVLAGQRVTCTQLTGVGHEFRYPHLEGALRHVLGRVHLGEPETAPSDS